jgi:hypothetical protein
MVLNVSLFFAFLSLRPVGFCVFDYAVRFPALSACFPPEAPRAWPAAVGPVPKETLFGTFDHTTRTPPDPVRSPKLKRVGPG